LVSRLLDARTFEFDRFVEDIEIARGSGLGRSYECGQQRRAQ
jgi:hypothetical protein